MTTLDNLRKTAKRWLKALRDGNADARVRLLRAYPAAPERATLRDVQHALARERGYESWSALTKVVVDSGSSETPLAALLAAAERGDESAVAAILDEHPRIINERGALPGHTACGRPCISAYGTKPLSGRSSIGAPTRTFAMRGTTRSRFTLPPSAAIFR